MACTSSASSDCSDVHNVLWTSGWDSTFRVLDLVSRKRCVVRPFYVVDETRHSLQMEIERMAEITQAVRSRRWPGQLETVECHPMPDPSRHPDIQLAWRELNADIGIGKQYEWLAVFAREQGLSDLELGIVPGGETERYLRSRVKAAVRKGDETHVLDDGNGPAHPLFENMELPMLSLTKSELGLLAKQRGFRDLLDRTWFCHAPLSGNHPCGACTPCFDAIKRGMAHRVGWRGHVVHRLPRRIRPLSRGLLGRIRLHR